MKSYNKLQGICKEDLKYGSTRGQIKKLKLQEIIDNLLSSKETYEFNIREEKNNDIYTNINITIRKVSD